MKLLAVRSARSIWLVPTYFLNPKGLFIRPIFEAIKARYSFIKTPLDYPFPPPAGEGLKFENGAFKGQSGTILIVSMTLHDDGIVLETRSSTDDGDAFLEDLLIWGSNEYGLPSYRELQIKKIYASELNVSFLKTPVIFNSKLDPFLKEASSIIGDEKKGKTDFLGFQLATDPGLSDKPPMFRFEREINIPFKENRYYSFAPTTTAAHLKLLEKLEEVAT